jgi:ATP-dependent DNA ligase
MLNVYEVIESCKETGSRTDKIAILQKNDSPELRRVLDFACSQYVTFGISKAEMSEPLDHNDFSHNLHEMFKLLEMLARRAITGNNAKEAIKKASAHLNGNQQKLLAAVLTKDLDCGIDRKTVNQAFPGLIPVFEVQLCNKNIDKVKYPAIAEIKRNGRRNIAVVNVDTVQHFSRNGKSHDNFDCFDKELIAIAAGLPCVFDGEVSGNTGDHKKDYKQASEQAKRKEGVDTKGLVFTVWDAISLGEWRKLKCMSKQKDRTNRLRNMLETYWTEHKVPADARTVLLSEMQIVNNREELEAAYKKALKEGHEGIIVKDMDAVYQFKRGDAWIKMKAEEEEDFKIIGVVEGKKSLAGHLGSVVVRVAKGAKAHCGLKGFTHKEARVLWKQRDKLIGQTAVVKFMNKTPDSLYLPKCIAIRDDK